MTLFGQGIAAIAGDAATADRLGWGRRRRSRPDPEIVLAPRAGDPRREPWVAPPWFDPGRGLEALRSRGARRRTWGYLAEPPGVDRCLRALAGPRPRGGWRVGLAGLGRVGGVAATTLAALPAGASGIRELLVHDADAANLERWLLELGSIARWRSADDGPRVGAASPAEMLARCDAFLFAACEPVPPPGARGDVRAVQFEPNRRILASFLEEARRADYAGLFLVVSDPVEALAQAAFHDGNSDRRGAFTGDGLAPERIAGLGLGVMWARSLAAARREGFELSAARRGAIYGPHGPDVAAFDDAARPDAARSAEMTRSARECNVRVRELGFVPYVGPGISSVALALPALLAGREVAASPLLDGTYFGAPARLDWGILPTARRLADEVWATVAELHGRVAGRAASLGLAWA